jgi:hypothetical protein
MPEQTSRTSADADSRLIFALMAWTGIFALVGHEIDENNSVVIPNATTSATTSATGTSLISLTSSGGVAGGAKIILGVFAGAALLSMLAHAGDAGRQWAIGLAVIAAVTSTLVKGKPVWDLISRLEGAGPGGTPTGKTTPTTQTTKVA